MSDSVAQLIAGALLVGVAALAYWMGYRAGFRRGASAAGGPKKRKHPFRVVQGEAGPPREPRPPRPPDSIH